MNITKEEKQEKKICVKLCKVAEQKPEPVPKKIITPKKPEQKKEIQRIIKPKKVEKELKKEPVLKKKVFVAKDEVISKVLPIEKKETPLPLPEDTTEKKVLEPIPMKENVETIEQKNRRLTQEYTDENIQKIRELIKDNLYYPRSARRRGIEGEVVVEFSVSTTPSVHSIEVIASQSDILSRSAIKTIQNIASDFPKPKAEIVLHVPINYKLD